MKSGTVATYGLRKRVEAVRDCRNIGKQDMKFNDSTPKMKVDPETYVRYHFFKSTNRLLPRLPGELLEMTGF